jgi:uncharacterized protein
MNTLPEKQQLLREALQGLGSVLIAYSGGIDSAYLAWFARQIPGLRRLAVLADSPSLARIHFQQAIAFAAQNQIPLEVIKTSEMENRDYVKNDMLRCFHCKNELFTKMEEARTRLGFDHLAYGMNLDDCGDFRPGQKAAVLHGVVAPLMDAGLTKSEIRSLAREAGLRIWDKPASACLSSRVAYGNPVTPEILGRVEQAEDHLRQLGLGQFRVRDHGGLARVEIAHEELREVLTPETLRNLTIALKKLGFKYVTLDCEGFRSGSMNAELSSTTLSSRHAHSLS